MEPAQEKVPGNRTLQQKINDLERQLAEEKRVSQKLLSISQFGQNLEDTPDVERIAQGMSRLLHRLFHCSLVGIYHLPVAQEPAMLLAAAGPSAGNAPGMLDPDSICLWSSQPSAILQTAPFLERWSPAGAFPAQQFPSVLFVPIPANNDLQGIILMADASPQAFRSSDDLVLQAAAARLAGEWEYARRANRMAEFVQSVGNLSMAQEAASLMEIIASIARRTLDASFTVVGAYHQKEWLLRSSGRAPVLNHSLQNGASSFLQAAIKTPYTFRLRDLRADPRSACIQLDSPELSSLLASPIIIHGNASFLLLAFGKISASGFSDDDVFLADLLSAHAAQNLAKTATPPKK
jgi:GAF domain-containing protein